jgi:hypothetical protein
MEVTNHRNFEPGFSPEGAKQQRPAGRNLKLGPETSTRNKSLDRVYAKAVQDQKADFWESKSTLVFAYEHPGASTCDRRLSRRA